MYYRQGSVIGNLNVDSIDQIFILKLNTQNSVTASSSSKTVAFPLFHELQPVSLFISDDAEEERTTIVIISGDADAMPATHKVLKYRGWNVEVCMWEDAMSNELKKLPQTEPTVMVNYLDQFLERIIFTNMKFNPRRLRSCEKATAVVFQMRPSAFRNRVPSKVWC